MIKKSFSRAKQYGGGKHTTIRFVKRQLHKLKRRIIKQEVCKATDWEEFSPEDGEKLTSAWDIS